MISYQEAIKIINKVSLNLPNEKISISDSLNRVCAKNVLSPSINPLSNNTAFDGFAVLAKETKGLSKKKITKFKILKTIGAGDNPKINNYLKNSSVEIMTGGIVPKPFDSIIPVEKIKYYPSEKKPTHIVVDHEVKKFSFIRFAGEDYNLKDVVIKKGEHGSLLFFEDLIFSSPAVSLENVVDPTGAGDSFAGAMMGYLTSKKKTDLASIKKSVVFGNVMGSFAVEGYGTEGLLRVKKSDIKKRMSQYEKMVSF